MTIELVNFINDLNPDYPLQGDLLGEGDNHIRNIKFGLKKTWPNIRGVVTKSHEEINRSPDTKEKILTMLELIPVEQVLHTTNQTERIKFRWNGQNLIAQLNSSPAGTILFDEYYKGDSNFRSGFPGYAAFPGGLRAQWGEVIAPGVADKPINTILQQSNFWPTSFPAGAIIVLTENVHLSGETRGMRVTAQDRFGFTFQYISTNGVAPSFKYLALGF